LLALPARAASGPRVVVEITQRAEQQIDPALTRRLIALELGDIEMPPKPGAPWASYTTVFFRVFVVGADVLRIELWDKGEFHGARRVSGEGSRQLRARRIALGAGELARRLRQNRIAEARHLAEEQQRIAREQAEREAWEYKPTLALAAGATAAAVGPSDLWLAGPGLSGQLRLARGARIDLGVRVLAGSAPDVDDSSVTWLEMSLAPSYALRVSPSFDVTVGVLAAAAAVRAPGATAVDGVEGEHETWSARAALFAYGEPRLAPWARLSIGPEIGAVLRRIPLEDAAGASHRLGGLWLGATVALVLDPQASL
jgi:hypothetical protein